MKALKECLAIMSCFLFTTLFSPASDGDRCNKYQYDRGQNRRDPDQRVAARQDLYNGQYRRQNRDDPKEGDNVDHSFIACPFDLLLVFYQDAQFAADVLDCWECRLLPADVRRFA